MAEELSPPAGAALLNNLKKAFNTFVNPFAYDPSQYYSVSSMLNPKVVSSGQPLSERDKMLDVLGRSGGLALGWAALALGIQKGLRRRKVEKQRESVVSSLATHRPVLAISPTTTAREEKQLEETGVPKEAADPVAELNKLELPAQQVRSTIPNIFDFFSVLKRNREESQGGDRVAAPMMAATLVVPLAALYAGWRYGEQGSDKAEAEQAKKQSLALRAKLNRSLAGELVRTRMPKEAGAVGDWWNRTFSAEGGKASPVSEALHAPVVSEPASLVTDPKGAWFNTKSLYWLWLIGSFATAYAVSRKQFDRLDPSRARLKELQRLARRRTLVEGAPVFSLAGVDQQEPELPRSLPARTPVSVEGASRREELPEYQQASYDPYQTVDMPEARLRLPKGD
jgi:hypothetical protein